MIDDIFHKFLIEGGQVCSSVRGGNTVTLPDEWLDLYEWEAKEEIKLKMVSAALSCKDFPGLSVAEVAEQLRIPYRHVLELIRFQHLGTIKLGGVIQVYQPSLDRYVQRQSERKSCCWLLI